jgi:hypothetical protein
MVVAERAVIASEAKQSRENAPRLDCFGLRPRNDGPAMNHAPLWGMENDKGNFALPPSILPITVELSGAFPPSFGFFMFKFPV